MTRQTRVSHPIYSLLPTEVEGFDGLAELALDMRWSWNHATDKVWRQLDPALWELTQNPWVVLQTVARDQLERMLADLAYRKNVDDLLRVDDWWAEAYTSKVGWALGDGQEHGDDPAWDAAEAVALYERLEREVIPEFYTRDDKGIPTAWVTRMRESMARLTPRFCANRTVCEYAEQHYLPAATAYHSRSANKGAIGRQVLDWRHSLEQKWAAVRFGQVKVETKGDHHVFDVQVYLEDLGANAISVELYADGGSPVRQEMKRVRQLPGAPGGYGYSAAVSAARPPADFTVRVIPRCDGVAIPLEDARILWQR